MAIAKQLVELHGGQIEAKSAGAGSGASFVVRFPIPAVARAAEFQREREASRPRQKSEFAPSAVLRGLRVLVVDDDDDARKLVKAVLEECGSEVTTASNATEGLEVLKRVKLDVLISDIGMPGKDGYDLIREVRALPFGHGGNIPAAALTAFARAEDRRRAIHAGYSSHIAKPVEPAELVAVVENLALGATPLAGPN